MENIKLRTLDIIENRLSAITTLLAITPKQALEGLPALQRLPSPPNPELWPPYTVYHSLLISNRTLPTPNHVKEARRLIVSNKTHLKQINLNGINLRGGVDLQNADLTRAFRREADLRGAGLRGANMIEVNLQYAVLAEAKLQKAYLNGADLQSAMLQGADLTGARLEDVIIGRGVRVMTRLSGKLVPFIVLTNFNRAKVDRKWQAVWRKCSDSIKDGCYEGKPEWID